MLSIPRRTFSARMRGPGAPSPIAHGPGRRTSRRPGKVSAVEAFALTPAERALFRALARRGVPFILIGMGAAVLEGAPIATQALDVWFERPDDERLPLAAADAGGFWISGFGMQPPSF